jgi:hypothetical protein
MMPGSSMKDIILNELLLEWKERNRRTDRLGIKNGGIETTKLSNRPFGPK